MEFFEPNPYWKWCLETDLGNFFLFLGEFLVVLSIQVFFPFPLSF